MLPARRCRRRRSRSAGRTPGRRGRRAGPPRPRRSGPGGRRPAPPTGRTACRRRRPAAGRTNGTRRLFTLRPTRPSRPGQQGDRGDHGDRDHQGRAPAHRGEHRDAGDLQAGDRDDHRDAGEEHGQTGGRVGPADRLGDRHALGEVLPVPGQDEQRVVDADAEPEHRRDDGGDGRHRDVAGRGCRSRCCRRTARSGRRRWAGSWPRASRTRWRARRSRWRGRASRCRAPRRPSRGRAGRCTRPACRRRAGPWWLRAAASYSAGPILSVSKASGGERRCGRPR